MPEIAAHVALSLWVASQGNPPLGNFCVAMVSTVGQAGAVGFVTTFVADQEPVKAAPGPSFETVPLMVEAALNANVPLVPTLPVKDRFAEVDPVLMMYRA